jgi:hypothetical protein
MTFDRPKTEHSLPGAEAEHSAPSFSAAMSPADVELLRYEIEVAGREHDAMARYEKAQEQRIGLMRDNLMGVIRREVARANEAELKATFCRAVTLEQKAITVRLMWWAGGYASGATLAAIAGWAKVWGWM